MSERSSRLHEPTLVQLNDGRWRVSCHQCRAAKAVPMPIGIELPITRRLEAEAILANHLEDNLAAA
jgi:hypothetical protein